MNSLKIVPFNPTKRRNIRMGALATLVAKAGRRQHKTKTEYLESYDRNILLRKLFHFAHGTQKIYFPISVYRYFHEDDNTCNSTNFNGANVKLAHEKIVEFLTKEGFDCVIEIEPPEPRSARELKKYPNYRPVAKSEIVVRGVAK